MKIFPDRLVFNKACLVPRRWWGRAGGRSAVSQQRYRASQRPVTSPSHQLTRSEVHKISARGIRVIYSNIYRFKPQDSRYEFWFQFQALNENRLLIPCSNLKRISQRERYSSAGAKPRVNFCHTVWWRKHFNSWERNWDSHTLTKHSCKAKDAGVSTHVVYKYCFPPASTRFPTIHLNVSFNAHYTWDFYVCF